MLNSALLLCRRQYLPRCLGIMYTFPPLCLPVWPLYRGWQSLFAPVPLTVARLFCGTCYICVYSPLVCGGRSLGLLPFVPPRFWSSWPLLPCLRSALPVPGRAGGTLRRPARLCVPSAPTPACLPGPCRGVLSRLPFGPSPSRPPSGN